MRFATCACADSRAVILAIALSSAAFRPSRSRSSEATRSIGAALARVGGVCGRATADEAAGRDAGEPSDTAPLTREPSSRAALFLAACLTRGAMRTNLKYRVFVPRFNIWTHRTDGGGAIVVEALRIFQFECDSKVQGAPLQLI